MKRWLIMVSIFVFEQLPSYRIPLSEFSRPYFATETVNKITFSIKMPAATVMFIARPPLQPVSLSSFQCRNRDRQDREELGLLLSSRCSISAAGRVRDP